MYHGGVNEEGSTCVFGALTHCSSRTRRSAIVVLFSFGGIYIVFSKAISLLLNNIEHHQLHKNIRRQTPPLWSNSSTSTGQPVYPSNRR